MLRSSPLQIGDPTTMGPYNLGRQRQPTLKLVADLLQQASLDLESALEEKALLLSRVCVLIKKYGRDFYVSTVFTRVFKYKNLKV